LAAAAVAKPSKPDAPRSQPLAVEALKEAGALRGVTPVTANGLTAWGLRLAGSAAPVDRPERALSPHGEFVFGNITISRATVPPVALNWAQRTMMKVSIASLDGPGVLLGLKDWRSRREARLAIARPRVATASPEPLGKLAVLVPGGGNHPPSAAVIFRAAQYSGRVVMAYQNLTDKKLNTLREVKVGELVEGVPLPRELAGKVFVFGSPEPGLADVEQAADALLAATAEMAAQKDLLGVDIMEVGATVIGHSEGAASCVVAKVKLIDAGLERVIKRVVSLGGGLGLVDRPSLADRPAAALQAGSLGILALRALGDDQPAFESFIRFAEEYRRLIPRGAVDALLDLSIAGVVGPPPKVRLRVGIPPFSYDDPHHIKPGIRASLAGAVMFGERLTMEHCLGSSLDSDGVVPTEYSRAGKKFVVLDAPHDHLGLVGDAAVMDTIAQELSPPLES
jgi:hypothetical protein